MRRKIVVLMGLDGSGKSSQAERLSSWLNARGVRTCVVWMRGESYLTLPLLKVAKAVLRAPAETKRGEGIKDTAGYEKYVRSKRSVFANRFLRAVWRNLALVDFLITFAVFFRRRVRGAQVVILDRYIYDTLVDIDSAFDAGGKEALRLLGSLWVKLVPRPDVVLLLEVSPERAMARKKDIPSVSYLAERHALYATIAGAVGARTVDAGKSIDEVTAALVAEVRGVVAEAEQDGR